MKSWVACTVVGVAVSLVGAAAAAGQTAWSMGDWEVLAQDSRVESYLGREALYLQGGTAWLRESDFQDGVIEFDLAAPSVQGFHGLRFRAADRLNHEYVYLRPHLSGKSDAVQYTPIDKGLSAWQMYSDERFIQAVDLPADRWMHVRIAIQGERMELSVDGQLLVFPELVRDLRAGRVGLAASAGGARFANVVVRPGADPAFTGQAGAESVPAPEGTVARWRVSDAFAETEVDGVVELSREQQDGRTWDTLTPHVRGIANIATLRTRADDTNTVFAAVTLRVPEARTVRVRIGFSDRVRAFLNGRQLFAAVDDYASRDYRFLGTMGLYDELFLPLEAGDNEVWLAISETFGGWGVSMQIPDGQGVAVR